MSSDNHVLRNPPVLFLVVLTALVMILSLAASADVVPPAERVLSLSCAFSPEEPPKTSGTVSGEPRTWYPVTLTFDGPETLEDAEPNPFRDYRLSVTFTHEDVTYTVPGFYAADGKAADTGAAAGNTWRVHFTPDREGAWMYRASFRTGTDVSISTEPDAGTAVSFDGASGTFRVLPAKKTDRDARSKGRLQYVGRHYLRFAETGEYFLKGGADSPENFLAYYEFDQTPNAKHRFEPHHDDFRASDPTWGDGKGKNIIGALNYLASKGMNSVYFLTMNVAGDGKDVWPWTAPDERYRFDCSKLDQWEIVFSHMDKLGLMLHMITQETENDQLLDSGGLGIQRMLYYRELIARFAHHDALVWNLGEENTNTDEERMAFACWFQELDPYDHPIVVHTFPNAYDKVYEPLLGFPYFEGPSLQTNDTHAQTVKWIDRSASAGRKWFVCLDEIGPAHTGVKPDVDDYWHDEVRTKHLWGNLMAGGAGVEWYFGYNFPHSDLDCEDWRSRDHMWDLTRYALEFFQKYIPFHEMRHHDELTAAPDDYCFAKPGHIYAIYLPNGGTTRLNLGESRDPFTIRWYNPRDGGPLVEGALTAVSGPGTVPIGTPPADTDNDWLALVGATRRVAPTMEHAR